MRSCGLSGGGSAWPCEVTEVRILPLVRCGRKRALRLRWRASGEVSTGSSQYRASAQQCLVLGARDRLEYALRKPGCRGDEPTGPRPNPTMDQEHWASARQAGETVRWLWESVRSLASSRACDRAQDRSVPSLGGKSGFESFEDPRLGSPPQNSTSLTGH